MKFASLGLLAFCLVALQPGFRNAQKKSAAGSSAADRQKLLDAYDVLDSLISSGYATDRSQSSDGNALFTFKQANVSVDAKDCVISWDADITERFEEKEQTTGDGRWVIPLSALDVRSVKVVPYGEGFGKKEGSEDSYAGFSLILGYLGKQFPIPSAMENPGNRKVISAGFILLNTQEDADRVSKALIYAAKSCGAHETAF